MALRDSFAGVIGYWENLTERERRFVGALGVVAAALLIFLPVFMFTMTISDLETENERIVSALRRIQRARPRLLAQQAEQAAAELRYASRPPALGSFLEAKAAEQEGLAISDVQREPQREEGRFHILHTRARLQGVGLRPAIRMLASIKNSRYPVAIERIHVDHSRPGDQYNFQIGVLAFERQGGGSPDAGVAGGGSDRAASTRGSRAGPPAP
ncbi:MAG: hypothetical protein AB7S26_37485 [Sandaracinaceae bacterium]